MKAEEVRAVLSRSKIWSEDRYGHFIRTHGNQKFRIKMGTTSLRIEFQAKICGKNEWIKKAGDYYKYVEHDIDGHTLLVKKMAIRL